ncbi:MAG: DUF1353 domain-containing protein [Pseudomonadota bacterium]|nr:DUF1353 domain-containing protein [Pseudomonadota bacterium]
MAQPDYWALAAAVTWDAPDLKLTIPKFFVTDFASIPRPLKNILDVDGDSRFAALLHDALYAWGVTTRAQADEQFRRALIAYEETSTVARVYWIGVRAGGWKPWDRYRAENSPTAESFASDGAYQAYRAAGSPFLTFKNLD